MSNWITVGRSLAAALTAYYLAAIFFSALPTLIQDRLLYPEDFPWYILSATRWLLWPAMLTARVGLVPAWPAVPTVLIALIALGSVAGNGRSGRPVARITILLAVFYLGVGVSYFVWLPVPVPTLSEFDACSAQLGEKYREAYAPAYRRGMYDRFLRAEGIMAPAISKGMYDGFFAGVREWEAVMPPLTHSEIRRVIAAIQEHPRSPAKEYDPCLDVPTQIYSIGP